MRILVLTTICLLNIRTRTRTSIYSKNIVLYQVFQNLIQEDMDSADTDKFMVEEMTEEAKGKVAEDITPIKCRGTMILTSL